MPVAGFKRSLSFCIVYLAENWLANEIGRGRPLRGDRLLVSFVCVSDRFPVTELVNFKGKSFDLVFSSRSIYMYTEHDIGNDALVADVSMQC